MTQQEHPRIVHGAATADEAAAVHRVLTLAAPRVLDDLARWRRARALAGRGAPTGRTTRADAVPAVRRPDVDD